MNTAPGRNPNLDGVGQSGGPKTPVNGDTEKTAGKKDGSLGEVGIGGAVD